MDMDLQKKRYNPSQMKNVSEGMTPQKSNKSGNSKRENDRSPANLSKKVNETPKSNKSATPISGLGTASSCEDEGSSQKMKDDIVLEQKNDEVVKDVIKSLSRSKDNENSSSDNPSLRDFVVMAEDLVTDDTKKNKWSYVIDLKKTVKKILPKRKKNENVDANIDLEISLRRNEYNQTYEGPTIFHNACYLATSLQEIQRCYLNVTKSDLKRNDDKGQSPLDLLFQNRALATSLRITDNSTQNINFDEKELMEVGMLATSIYEETQCEISWITFKNWIAKVEDSEALRKETQSKWFSMIFGKSDDLDISNIEDINSQQSPEFDFDEHQNIDLPLQVDFALKLLTCMIDYLSSSSDMQKKIQLKAVCSPKNTRNSLDSSINSKSTKRFLRRKWRYNQNEKLNDDLSHSSMGDQFHQNPKDSITKLVHGFASISNIMKSFLLIDDDSIRKNIFEVNIIKQAMLSRHSIEGSWLGEMLQHYQRKRATEYLMLLSELSTKEARNAEQRDDDQMKQQLKELFQTIGELEGFLPSMLAVGDSDIEDLATTPMIMKVLDEMTVMPFSSTLFFFDLVLLGLLIFFFRSCVDRYLQRQESDIVLKWLYATILCAFHFQMREIARLVSLVSMTRNDVFRNAIFFNVWGILHTACLFLLIWSIITIRYYAPEGKDNYLLDEKVRSQFSVTTLLLWLNLLGLVKSMNAKLATFVSAIIQIVKDVLWYVVLIIGMILCFSQVFYTMLIPSDCVQNSSIKECKPAEYYLITYSVLLGELDEDLIVGIEDKVLALVLFFGFSFMMAIVMLNILIAVISESYEKSMLRSTKLFGRARVYQLAEILALQDLFRVKSNNRLCNQCFASKYFQWTEGGFVFFVITTCLYIMWIIIDVSATTPNLRHISLIVLLLNFIVFGIFLFFLAASAQEIESKVNIGGKFVQSIQKGIQWLMIRVLSRSHNTLLDEQWDGRLIYIKKEIAASTKEIKKSLETIQQKTKQNEKQTIELRKRIEQQMKLFEQQMQKMLD